MFSAIIYFLIIRFSAMALHQNNTKELNEFGFSPKDDSLMGQFLRDHRINTYVRSKYTGVTGLRNYHLVWSIISYLPDKVIQNEPMSTMKLLNNIFPLLQLPFVLPRSKSIIYGTFQHIISNVPLRKYENDDWILRVWNPYRDKIIGLAVYEDIGKGYRIEEIYNNQTESDIGVNALIIAGYIPEEFLMKLSDGRSNEELQNITVRMMVILNGKKFKGLWYQKEDIEHLIGVSVPGFCKNDRVPFLRAYFKSGGNGSGIWTEFGSRYIDYPPEYIKQLCFLSQTVFFGRLSQNKYYDSVTENHCIIPDTGELISMFLFATGDIKIGMPNRLCMKNYRIQIDLCVRGEVTYKYRTKIPCEYSFPSNKTKSFFESLKFCGSMRIGSFCSERLSDMMNGATSYLDVFIALKFLDIITYRSKEDGQRIPKYRLDLIERGLSFIEKEKEQISMLCSLSLSLIRVPITYEIHATSRMTFLEFNFRADIVGFVTFKSNTSSIGYDVKLLTENNATLNYSSDPNVKVIAYVIKPHRNFSSVCHIFAFYGNYVEYTNHTLKSDIIEAYCNIDTPIINIYLSAKDVHRGKEYYLNEGYSSIIKLKMVRYSTLYIFEVKDTICDPVSKLAIFETYIPSTDLNSIHSGNLTYRNFDLLSHLSLTVNEDTQDVIEEQSTALKTLTIILSSLSLLGIFIVLLSAIFLKNWYQQRPYSMQLIISVAGETIFFLISESYISQIGYIIFYYFLLSQFIWMLIIGYLQYIRYVKVFESFELNLFKTSLLGWISPVLITLISILSHLECLQCNFCSKNRDILLHFFLIPISIIVLTNTGLYVYVMVVIARSGTEMFEPEARTARKKATLFLPSILGIFWIFFGMLFIPNLGISIVGTYIFHVIASSQGLMIFIFVVLLDMNTLIEWYEICACFKKPKNAVAAMELELRRRE